MTQVLGYRGLGLGLGVVSTAHPCSLCFFLKAWFCLRYCRVNPKLKP